MPESPRSPGQPSPRPLFAVAVAAALVGFLLTLSFGFADHAPHRTACGSRWPRRRLGRPRPGGQGEGAPGTVGRT